MVEKFEVGTHIVLRAEKMDADVYLDAFIVEVCTLGGVPGVVTNAQPDYSDEIEVRLDLALESLDNNSTVWISPKALDLAEPEKSLTTLDLLDREIADRESQLAKLKEARTIIADLL